MALTVEDINAVRAQWEEWVDNAFALSIEVIVDDVDASMVRSEIPMARVQSDSRYCQVEIRKRESRSGFDPAAIADAFEVPARMVEGDKPAASRIVFSKRVPYDARALRICVAAYARQIARWQEEQDGAHADEVS